MKPIIILTATPGKNWKGVPNWMVNRDYAEAVERAGGIPVLAVSIECAADYAQIADGLLLTGGADVDPALYGQEKKFDSVEVDPVRDELEWGLIREFAAAGKPVFAICRGIQSLNVYFGGTLIQDLPSECGSDHANGVCHEVTLKEDSIPGKIYGPTLLTNSYHHQAIDTLADCFEPVAWSDANGRAIVEGIEHKTLPIWAVQWHPERMTGSVTNPEGCEDSLPLFEYFVDQCSRK